MKSANTEHKDLLQWVDDMARMCKPDSVYWCDGSKKEYDSIMAHAVEVGSAIPLKKRPNSFLFRSQPSDVARVEDRTYISYHEESQAGPTNNWIETDELKGIMRGPIGARRGRTMYISPTPWAPSSRHSKDRHRDHGQSYVVCNMHI
jgi:phosphoenolpyruvate carboxykinase (GTP)